MSDFGISTVRSCSTMSKAEAVDTDSVGALRWRAPECLTKQPVFASDVYSFAMCIIEAVTDAVPFYGLLDDAVRENLRNGGIPDRPDGIADDVWDLVVGMTNSNLTKRVSLQQVIERLRGLKEREEAALRHIDTPKFCNVCNVVVVGDSHSCANGKSAPPSSTPRSASSAVRSALTDVQVLFSLPSLNNNRVTALLKQVQSASDSKKEKILLDLVQECADNEQRAVLYAANGVQLLMSLIRSGQTFFTQVYALECLDWDQARPLTREFLSLSWMVFVIVSEILSCKNHCEALREAGVIDPWTALLRKGTDTQKLWAAEALRKLTITNGACRLEAVEREAIGPLVSLILVDREMVIQEIFQGAASQLVAILTGGTDDQNVSATVLIGTAVYNSANGSELGRLGGIPPLVALLRSENSLLKEKAAEIITTLTATAPTLSLDIVQHGAIAPLVQMLQSGTEHGKECAASALAYISQRQSTIATEVVRHGAIPLLVALVTEGTDEQKRRATSALGNLAYGNIQAGSEIVRHGAIAPLVLYLTSAPKSQRRAATLLLLQNLAHGNPTVAEAIVNQGAIGPLRQLLQAGSDVEEIAAHTVIGTAIMSAGAIPSLIALLDRGCDVSALTLGKIADNNMPALNEMVRQGAVDSLIALLARGNPEGLAAYALECIAKGGGSFARMIAREGAIPLLVKLLSCGSERGKVTAASALGYLARSSHFVAVEIIDNGAVLPLRQLQETGTSDKVTAVVQFALSQIQSGCCLIL